MPHNVAFRGTVLLLWGLAIVNSLTCRGLFWDGGSFFVDIIDDRDFHDFFTSRAHVTWLTELPLVLALKAGVTDNTRVLAMVLSAGLFALPAALYHLALARLRHDPTALALAIAAVAVVYLPTSFFIIGEYNATYAAVTAAMAVALTFEGRRDGLILCLLALFCLRSYESMIYFGPLLAAASLRGGQRGRRDDDNDDVVARMLRRISAVAFLSSVIVALSTFIRYWSEPYFTAVRAATFDFWQNLQFMVPFAGLACFAAITLVRPRWLLGKGPAILIGVIALLLTVAPWAYMLKPGTILFPPAHYIARTAAGGVLLALLVVLWVHRAWRGRPIALIDMLRRPEVGRKLAAAMLALTMASAVPDIVLTRIWIDYLGHVRGLVAGNTGYLKASTVPTLEWPQRMFSQAWTLPAFSVILRSSPSDAVVVDDVEGFINQPFDPACGTVPRLTGLSWR